MATSFLRFCRTGNVDGMTFASTAGACSSGIGCAVGRVYTGYTGYTGSVEGKCNLCS